MARKSAKPETVYRVVLTARQFHTTIAALRLFQALLRPSSSRIEPKIQDIIHDIATNGDEVTQLSESEIEALIQKLNCGG